MHNNQIEFYFARICATSRRDLPEYHRIVKFRMYQYSRRNFSPDNPVLYRCVLGQMILLLHGILSNVRVNSAYLN